MAKHNLKLAPTAGSKPPIDRSDDLGFDINEVEGAIVLTPKVGVAHTVLFRESALILSAIIRSLAETLPELSESEQARILREARDV